MMCMSAYPVVLSCSHHVRFCPLFPCRLWLASLLVAVFLLRLAAVCLLHGAQRLRPFLLAEHRGPAMIHNFCYHAQLEESFPRGT